MIGDSIIYMTALLILVALAAGYFHPLSSPYVRKYGWIALGFVLLGVALLILRRRPGRSATDLSKHIKDESMTTVDRIMERAEEQALLADVELAQRQLMSENDRMSYRAQVSALKNVKDSRERRAALIRLVEEAGE